jgi:hypothetical protein
MTIRAKEPKVFSAIIMPVTIDMINRQQQRLAIPNGFQSTERTAIRNACFNHRAAQLKSLFVMRERVP